MSDYHTPADPPVCAIVYKPNSDEVYDRCYTWEAGQTYANTGYVVKAVADDGYMDKDRMQRLFDWERDMFIDCYGRNIPFDWED